MMIFGDSKSLLLLILMRPTAHLIDEWKHTFLWRLLSGETVLLKRKCDVEDENKGELTSSHANTMDGKLTILVSCS